jgi:hypothetical protein
MRIPPRKLMLLLMIMKTMTKRAKNRKSGARPARLRFPPPVEKKVGVAIPERCGDT